MTNKEKPCLMDAAIEELKEGVCGESFPPCNRCYACEWIDTWYAKTKKELKGMAVDVVTLRYSLNAIPTKGVIE